MDETYVKEMLTFLYRDARDRFGDAIRAHWFYEPEGCPGCGFEVDFLEEGDGKRLFSLNAFIYRERGVLIGYFLCGACLQQVRKALRRGPFRKSPIHTAIEETLVAAYRDHIRSMDA
ncbi:MAG TPA: hypothetical protein VMN57_09335 [Anaerolineales bacterium]|nr:hypothetical protein [Anaerolineales bacterium]